MKNYHQSKLLVPELELQRSEQETNRAHAKPGCEIKGDKRITMMCIYDKPRRETRCKKYARNMRL